MDSKGNIFYIQKRIGKNNKTFSCYKFRTMKPEAKYLLKLLDLIKKNMTMINTMHYKRHRKLIHLDNFQI